MKVQLTWTTTTPASGLEKKNDCVPSAETAAFACLGSDGTSYNGQTHLSCPQAATRLIEPERRCCKVKDEVVPCINAGFDGDIA